MPMILHLDHTLETIPSMLKYDRINISNSDAAKLVDIYLRIINALDPENDQNNNDDCYSENVISYIHENQSYIDFNDMDETGIESIKNFILEINKNAIYPFSDNGLEILLKDNNIIIAMQKVHQFITTIYAIYNDIDNAGDNAKQKLAMQSVSFITENDDNSYLMIPSCACKNKSDDKMYITLLSTMLQQKV